MEYETMFYMMIAFIVGRLSKLKIYIGYDEEKYKAADISILRR